MSYYERRLPHWHPEDAWLFITWRLAGSLPATQGSRSALPVSDAWLGEAQHVLATHLGPIALVVVKRAASRTRLREPLTTLLAEAVPEIARAQVRAELARL